jgi:hypothetical protein
MAPFYCLYCERWNEHSPDLYVLHHRGAINLPQPGKAATKPYRGFAQIYADNRCARATSGRVGLWEIMSSVQFR